MEVGEKSITATRFGLASSSVRDYQAGLLGTCPENGPQENRNRKQRPTDNTQRIIVQSVPAKKGGEGTGSELCFSSSDWLRDPPRAEHSSLVY